MLEFRLLGPVEVSDGGRPVVLQHRQRALVACLALRPGETLSSDALVDALWGPTPPRTVGAALHNAVSQTRKALGGDVLRTRAPGYVLDVDAECVDAHQFARLAAEARAASAAAGRAALLRDALGLWHGRALADVADEPFAAVEVSRLEELRLSAREDLLEAEIALGRHADVLADAEALVAEQPFSERARALLLIALYRSGRQADALEAYQATRAFLREELGLEPSPALRKLQAAMLRQDPALDPPVVETALPIGEERRKTVSVLFTDIVDSTGLAGELDPEAYRAVLRRWYRAARAVLEAHGGTVEKFIGDAVVGLFGVPRQREDDAARAVRAAVELNERLAEVNAELEAAHGVRIEIRTGVNTGEAVAGEEGSAHAVATGYAVNVAAKLQQSAPPGGVLVGPATYALVRDAVEAAPVEPLALGSRGISVTPYRVVAVDRGSPGLARRLDAPLVGRADELATLRAAFAGAVAEARARVVTVVGDAGVGKSRLAAELVASVGDQATVVVGRCVSYGEGATLLPVTEIVAQLAGSRSEARIAALLPGAPDARLVARRLRELLAWDEGSPPPGEGFWAVRRLLEARAAERPLVVLLDDVHWAEPTLLDLVEHLDEHARAIPLVVLCLARPDLLEARPRWTVSLALAPLPEESAGRLVDGIEGASDLPERVRSRIVAVAEGNALFVEQLTAHVLERGEGALEVPPASVESVLASRLDLLPEPERSVLERAAVVGREFWLGAAEALSGRDVSAELEALAAKGLVRAVPSLLAEEEAYRFRHVLIRDVAYASATKERRSRLHELAAAWLAERERGSDEVIGFHLEQAYVFRTELRPGGEADDLAERAGTRLARAGIRALQRADLPAAVNLLERATRLLPDGERLAETLCELGVALWMNGRGDRVGPAFEDAGAAARRAGARRVEVRAAVELAHAGLYGVGDLQASPEEVLSAGEAAVAELEGIGDERGLGRAWLAIGDAHSVRLHCARWGGAARAALTHYRAGGFAQSSGASSVVAASYWGADPVPSAVERCAEILAEVGDDQMARASVSTILGALEAMRGRFDTADELLEAARRTFEELGQGIALAASWSGFKASVAELAGDEAAREQTLRASCEALTEMRQHADLALRAAELAEALQARGALDEAEVMLDLAEQHAAPDDIFPHFVCSTVRARLLARAGETRKARLLAERAVALVEPTDALDLQAKALLAAATVSALAGEPPRATTSLVERAVALYRRKGNTVMARRAASAVDALVRA